MTMVISGSDGITFPDSTNQFSGGAFSFKNRLINSDMRIDQRNVGAPVTINAASRTYGVDRWLGYGQATDGVFTIDQDTDAPTGFVNSTKVTTTTADASVGASQFYLFGQSIEGTNVSDLSWGSASAKTITLSFWVRSSLTGTFGGSLNNSAANRSYPFTYSISVADTWEQKSVTIAGDTSGTWLTTTGIGINVWFDLGCGSSNVGTAGSWAGAAYYGATGGTKLISTLNATWYVTGVQFEVGSVATPFERRPFGLELELCQRYYEKSYSEADIAGASARGSANLFVSSVTNGYLYGSVSYKTQKRAKPTVTIYSYNGTAGRGTDGNATDLAANAMDVAQNTNFSGTSGFVVQNNSGGTLTPAGNNIIFNWVASIEL